MGKATGFLEFARALPVLRAPGERVHDWQEFHEHFDEETLQQQGGRCELQVVIPIEKLIEAAGNSGI